MTTDYLHRSVLTREVKEYLNLQPGGIYLDATLGDGGHTLALLEAGVKVIALDQDPEAIERAEKRLSSTLPKVILHQTQSPVHDLEKNDCLLLKTNFSRLEEVVKIKLDGILFDLGVSTLQLLKPERGFTFQSDGPLDMRMDPELGVTAADLLNAFSEKELAKLFQELGGETYAKPIAAKIALVRKHQPITTTSQLANLISRVKFPTGKIHPATKVFQALRMAVNLERDALKITLPQAVNLLKPEGRLVIISFHSGEDAIVKLFFRDQAEKGQLKILTSKPVKPTEEEKNINPRSRSAKLRSAQKI